MFLNKLKYSLSEHHLRKTFSCGNLKKKICDTPATSLTIISLIKTS